MAELSVQEGSGGVPLAAAGLPPSNPHYRAPAGGPTIMFPLPNDNTIEIRLKKPVSEKDFKQIQALIALSKDSLVSE